MKELGISLPPTVAPGVDLELDGRVMDQYEPTVKDRCWDSISHGTRGTRLFALAAVDKVRPQLGERKRDNLKAHERTGEPSWQ